MATTPLKKHLATKWLKMIIATRGASKSPCAFAIGRHGQKNYVVVATRGKPNKARTLAGKEYAWDGNAAYGKKNMALKCDVVATGFAKLDGGELKLEFAKGTFKNFKKAAQNFFKTGFNLKPAWKTITIADMTEASEAAYNALDDDEAFDVDGEVPDFEQLQAEFADQEFEAAEEVDLSANAPAEPNLDDDSPFAPDEKENATAWADASDISDADSDDESDDEEEMDPQERRIAEAKASLSPELRREVEAKAKEMAEHLVKLSDSIGLPPGSAIEDITAKIEGWLVLMLAATPEEERAAKLENFVARLTLALCHVENLKDVRHANKARRPSKDRQQSVDADGKIGNLDLNDVAVDKLTVEEVVEELFEYAKDVGRKRGLPYDFDKASFEKIDKIVRSGWPRDESVPKRPIIERLIGALRGQFANDDRLINILALSGHRLPDGVVPPAAAETAEPVEEEEAEEAREEPDVPLDLAAADSLIEPAVNGWRQAYGMAKSDLDELKGVVDEALEATDPSWAIGQPPVGGSWQAAESELAKISVEAVAALTLAVRNKEGAERLNAIADAERQVEQYRALIQGSNIFHLLATAPFGKGEYVGPHLADGLRGVTAALNRARQADSLAAAAE